MVELTVTLLNVLLPEISDVVTVSKMIVPPDALKVPSPPRLPLSVNVLLLAPRLTEVPD